MPLPRNVLTPEALAMIDLIARTGSFAAAARELGKVPSALTYSVRQLEDALDVLLFDRRSRQARLTAAGEELLREGRRLLGEIDAVANRVKRVATGWERQLTITVDSIIAPAAIFDLAQAFFEERPPTHLKLRQDVLSGTWEALLNGQADLAIGVVVDAAVAAGIFSKPLGDTEMVFVVAPHHPLAREAEPLALQTVARHRIVAIADTARQLAPITVGVQSGQDVLTVHSLAAKLEAQLRGLGCGWLPEPLARRHVQAGHLVHKRTESPYRRVRLSYAWRDVSGGRRPGLALKWWVDQLENPVTRRALLEQHAGLIF